MSGKNTEPTVFKEYIPQKRTWKAGIEFNNLTLLEADKLMRLLANWISNAAPSYDFSNQSIIGEKENE